MRTEPHVLELMISPKVRVNDLEPGRWNVDTLIARAAARVVDLRGVMDILDEVAVECMAGIDEDGTRVLDNIHVAKDAPTQFYIPLHRPLPLLAEPRIALEGWYLFEDGVAGFLEPLSDTQYVLDLWFRTPTGQVWSAGVATMISLDPVDDWDAEDDYGVVVNYWYWTTYAKRAGIKAAESDVERIQQMFNDTSVLESAAIFGYVVLLANSFALADPRVILHKDTSTKLLKAAARRKRPKVARYTTIDLPGLRYDSKRGSFSAKRGDGVAWHMVRGHYRTLVAERFANKKGQRVWVRPHTRGHEEHGIAKGAYTITSARGEQG